MEATRTRSATGFGQSWRELAHTPTHQVPIVLGSIVALLVGILTYLFAAANASAIVPATPEMAYMVIFGIVGLIAYGVAKQNDTEDDHIGHLGRRRHDRAGIRRSEEIGQDAHEQRHDRTKYDGHLVRRGVREFAPRLAEPGG